MRIRVLLLFAGFCMLGGSSSFAQGNAGQAGEFLRWGVGAKAMGLGRAFTSVADDASSLYWNPAGLSSLSKIGGTMMFMHLPLREGASVNYLAGAVPLRLFFTTYQGGSALVNTIQDIKLGLGVVWHSLGSFERYDEGANRLDDGGANSIGESAVYISASYPVNGIMKRLTGGDALSWARFLRGSLELGVSTKIISQDLFGFTGSATSLDLGLKYTHVSGFLSTGFVLRDFNGPTLSYDSNILGDEIPANGVLGISVTPPFGILNGLLLSFDYGIIAPTDRENDRMFGLQYDLSYIDSDLPVQIRIGTNSTHESLTIGLNFNPENLIDQDWAPSCDWTYANNRSSFDATGALYSFSIDRNPFTARYWYANARSLFETGVCDDDERIKNTDRIALYLRNTLEAKNPGGRAYRYEASLRSADLAFLSELTSLQASKETDKQDLRHAVKAFQDIVEHYQKGSQKYLAMDSGKSELDHDDYFRSLIYYIQSTILAGNAAKAVAVSGNGGDSWGRGIDFRQAPGGNNGVKKQHQHHLEYLDYLHAYALYASNRHGEVRDVIYTRLQNSDLASFLLGHVSFLAGDYQGTLATLSDIDLNDTRFPEDIYLPITNDCTFGDELLFLRAASMYKLLPEGSADECINEFAKIPRFFPQSDLARFMTNGSQILTTLIAAHQLGQKHKVDELVSKMIDSYIKTFSSGPLIEEFYTLNYR